MAHPQIEHGATTHTFVRLKAVDIAAQEVEIRQRLGLSGLFLRRTGRRGRPYTMEAMLDMVLANTAAIEAAEDAFKDLQGEIVTVINEHGVERAGIAILEVGVITFKKAALVVGGINGTSATHVVTFNMVCADTKAT